VSESNHPLNIADKSNSIQKDDALLRPSNEASHRPPASWLGWLRGALTTVTVFAFLGGIAFFGHATGWSVPKFAELIGGPASQDEDWCKEHNVPESLCVECNAALLPKVKSVWCSTHGVHDCPLERPELVQLKEPPAITRNDLERAQRALALKSRPENNPTCKLHERRIQLSSEEMMEKMGIDVRPVSEAPVMETVTASGEIIFEGPRVAPIFTSVSGRVWHVTETGQIGAKVKRGDVLAVVDSMEVGKAKGEFLQAFAQLELRNKTFEKLSSLLRSGSIPESRYLEADTALREAQIRLLTAQQSLLNLGLSVRSDDVKGLAPEELSKRLLFLGLPDALVQKLDYRTTTANLIPVVASHAGTVIASKIVAGEMVDHSKNLFVVADTSQMWLILNVRNEDVKYLRKRDGEQGTPGQLVRFRPDGSDQDVSGELVWISNTVDEKTRTVQVRVNVPNPDGKLLANTFGMGRIVLRQEKNAVVVPNEALHWEKDCHVVFVRDKNFLSEGAPKVFHVRTVRPGVKMGENTEIVAGLLPGEVIATKNSALLRAELLKGSLGDGCGCGH
jgi:cobalt-zinc-cadmium efflux system membrane fusion protein